MTAAHASAIAELVIISGLAGSGKSTALNALEDAGWFCVDNLPTKLLETFMRLIGDHPSIERVALATDVREARLAPDVPRRIVELKAAFPCLRVLFFDADDDKLIARFKETRRRHPLIASGAASTVAEALASEREWLMPIRHLAGTVIDTSQLTVHDLKRRVRDLLVDPADDSMQVSVMSFGFRHGLPPEADFVFDVRFLKNPYFVDDLRGGTGLEASVADYVLSSEHAAMMLDHVEHMIADVLPLAEREGKTAMTIAIGCTGGHHRSVAIAEALRGRLVRRGHDPVVTHRDIER